VSKFVNVDGHRCRVITTMSQAGRVIDARGTGLLPPNGGVIPLYLAIEHIPVVPNVKGYADFGTLARVLRAQGLSLQTATDAEGNVILYNDLNRLCYQARGSNSISYGTEHMHMTVGERWTKEQEYASAWLWAYAFRRFGLPLQVAKMGSGNPTPVHRRGHTSHKQQSIRAGYHDRSDPGPGYKFGRVQHAAKFHVEHGAFRIRRNGRLVTAL
jgi:hypothetical protein